MLCGTLRNIPHLHNECGEHSTKYCQSPQNTIMNLNNVMLAFMLWSTQQGCKVRWVDLEMVTFLVPASPLLLGYGNTRFSIR